MAEITGNDQIDTMLWLVVAVGAANWLFVTGANVDLISDVIGLGSQASTSMYLAIGAAGTAGALSIVNEQLGVV